MCVCVFPSYCTSGGFSYLTNEYTKNVGLQTHNVMYKKAILHLDLIIIIIIIL